jgi:hypothetical protein
MKTYSFVALDTEGNVVVEKETKEGWYISELSLFLDEAGPGLYKGDIASVIISEVE